MDKRVAILPLRTASETRIDPYLLDGLCDDISTRLSKLETVHIVSLESTLPLRKISKKHIIRNVEADIALVGKIRETDEDNIHLNIHLIEVKSKVIIWSESYDFHRTAQ